MSMMAAISCVSIKDSRFVTSAQWRSMKTKVMTLCKITIGRMTMRIERA